MNARPLHTVLVSMPWPYLSVPSIQMGTVTAILRRAGYSVRPFSAYLLFMDWLVERSEGLPEKERLTVPVYDALAEHSWQNGLGDWVFAVPPFRTLDDERDRAYLEYVKTRENAEFIEAARRIRPIVDDYLERCVSEILRDDPDVVGFTTTFNQNVPSLNVAARLKARRPELTILFGGANCDGPMGAGLHRAFGQIDYVVRGEAEYALPLAMEAIAGTREPSTVPGLVYRQNGETTVNASPASAAVAMKDVPTPDYDEYFERLRRSRIRPAIDAGVSIPVESSRGCWWGEKHHCTFCGLNGSTIAFRSKDPDHFARELYGLAGRYRRTRFQPVDNILDLRYFKTLIPWLKSTRESGNDWGFFYETKANLKKEQLALLRDAGVTQIQPGLESLSTPVLKLMDKGVTALQNIRMLKWAREYGIGVSWNLLYGFPGETADLYEHVYDLIPSLVHLEPPGVSRLLLERFSPYFDRHAEYGIDVKGPARFYGLIYPLDREQLMEIAYDFEYYIDSLEQNPWIGKIRRLVAETWNYKRARRDNEPCSLTYVRGAGFVTIYDRRNGLPPQDLVLSGSAARIYLACDAGKSVAQLRAELELGLEDEHVRELLDDLVAKRLMYEENGVYLALAVAIRPVLDYRDVPPPVEAPREAVAL
jgi:ribosomal peptide maturation radical SAM protein 1